MKLSHRVVGEEHVGRPRREQKRRLLLGGTSAVGFAAATREVEVAALGERRFAGGACLHVMRIRQDQRWLSSSSGGASIGGDNEYCAPEMRGNSDVGSNMTFPLAPRARRTWDFASSGARSARRGAEC